MESQETASITVDAPMPVHRNPQSHKSPVQGLHSPPESNGAPKVDGSDSELSELDDDVASISGQRSGADAYPKIAAAANSAAEHTNERTEETSEQDEDKDISEILPAEWAGTVPVFRPSMKQFKDFKLFMEKVDRYGMTHGIIKIIPPQEWKDSLPPYDNLVKNIRIRDPIKQDIMGSNGMYRQVNIVHGRSYNLPQWKMLCEQSEHQPPARRGERRANADKPKPPRTRASARKSAAEGDLLLATPSPGSTRGRSGRARARGRGRSRGMRGGPSARFTIQRPENDERTVEDRPMTPVSPKPHQTAGGYVDAGANQAVKDENPAEEKIPSVSGMGEIRQPRAKDGKQQSTSARRKYSKREASAAIDEKAFVGWDYKMDISEYTPDRCEELEKIYWKTLTYAQPLYGADLMGTLFDEKAEIWNLNKLPNLLDVLGTKVPGVNTAYLYMGMWKATFAWHLEDVDLYSINYLHFGAPKQWYSISQADMRRFEAAMRSIWPTEAKACDQFLRHKGFLISPSHLLQHHNIRVNKCLSYPGEFVVTYPYGYHAGFNLGYNCAEAVNFALDSWLPIGKIAKRCECNQAQDSVWVDVHDIERRLRGGETEYEETDEEGDIEEDSGDGEEDNANEYPRDSSNRVPTVRIRAPARKRARIAKGVKEARSGTVKKVRIRSNAVTDAPCCLCPNDIPGQEILPTDDSRKAHRMCALYIPETFIEVSGKQEVVSNVAKLAKDRLALKCLYCRTRKGACLQCSQPKCARAYHPTCAAAAGVFVEDGEIPIIDEHGTEYKEQVFEFSCRFHRTKRDKKLDGNILESCARTRKAAAAAKKGDIIQAQYYRGDIFAGVVAENNHSEQTLLLDVIPSSDRVEIEWKWLLVPDPADFQLPKASAKAIPMPTSRQAKDKINATRRESQEMPKPGAPFVEGHTWAEFNVSDIPIQNRNQQNVDIVSRSMAASSTTKLWHYIYQGSTDTKDRYTEDPSNPRHNSKSVYLDTLPKPSPQLLAPARPSLNHSPLSSGPPPVLGYQASSATKLRTPMTSAMFSTSNAPQSVSQAPRKHVSSGGVAGASQSITGKPKPAKQSKQSRPEKPYVYKPRNPVPPNSDDIFANKAFTSRKRLNLSTQITDTRFDSKTSPLGHSFTAQRFEPALAHGYNPRHGLSFLPPKADRVSTSAMSPQAPISACTPVGSPITLGTGKASQAQAVPNGWSTQGSGEAASTSASASKQPHRSEIVSQARESPLSVQPCDVSSPSMGASLMQLRPQFAAQSEKIQRSRRQSPEEQQHQRHALAHGQSSTLSKSSQHYLMEKYSYYKMSHNRDPTTYKTPYAPRFGFTNGYEGNFRAHLMATQGSLFGTQPNSSSSPPPTYSSSYRPSSVHAAQHSRLQKGDLFPTSPTAYPPHISQAHVGAEFAQAHQPWSIKQPGSVPLHRAIRPQYQGVVVNPQQFTASQPSAGEQAMASPLPPQTIMETSSQMVSSPPTSEDSATSRTYQLSSTQLQEPAAYTPAQIVSLKRKADEQGAASGPPHPSIRASTSQEASAHHREAVAPAVPRSIGFPAGAKTETGEFPSVEPNSTALMERMMANLRKASEKARE